jgi:GT2 family glycosyltransferase
MNDTENVVNISIIIISYNNKSTLENTLISIYKQVKETDFEIIIVDNASTENNVNMIRDEFQNVKIIENKTNKGFAYACNQGAKIAQGNILLFINSDIILQDNPIPKMLILFNKLPNIGIIGCQLLNSDKTYQPSYYSKPSLIKRFLDLIGIKKQLLLFQYNQRARTEEYFEVEIVKGAFMMITSSLFKELNGFDEKYFMYMEDVDLSFRCLKQGKRNLILNTTNVIHLGWHINSIKNPVAYLHGNYGLVRFYKKNMNWLKFNVLLIMSIPFYLLRYLLKLIFSSQNKEMYYLKVILDMYLISLLKQKDINLIDTN